MQVDAAVNALLEVADGEISFKEFETLYKEITPKEYIQSDAWRVFNTITLDRTEQVQDVQSGP